MCRSGNDTMLPNLAGISLHSKALNGVRDVGVNLEGMPGEILSMIIGDTGYDARSLCAAADTLRQTSKDLANHLAWLSLANKYNMPDTPTHPRPPSDSKDVEKWRKFVLSWCDDIRDGDIKVGGHNINYDLRALLLEQSDGTAVGYKWLLDHGDFMGGCGWGDGVGDVAGERWMLGMAIDNVTNHKKLEILKLQLYDLGLHHNNLGVPGPETNRRNQIRTLDVMEELFEGAVNGIEFGNLHDSVSIVSYLHHTRKALVLADALYNEEEETGLEQVDRIVNDEYDVISKTSAKRGGTLFLGFAMRQEKFLQMVVPLMESGCLYEFMTFTVREDMKPTWRNLVIRPPSSTAITNFLCNVLQNDQLETADWFFTRHENLVRKNPDILDSIEIEVLVSGWTTAADEMVKEWRRRVPEPPPPP